MQTMHRDWVIKQLMTNTDPDDEEEIPDYLRMDNDELLAEFCLAGLAKIHFPEVDEQFLYVII